MSEAERFRIRDVLRIPEIRAAMLGTFVVMLGYGILSPVLPNYARSFGVGYDSIGLLISSFAFARLVSDPFVGRYIDRYGERAMATLGAVWVGVSSFAAALAPTFPLLVLFRALGGVGSALFFASLLSFLLRSIPSRQTGRVMSVYYASFNIGFIAGGPLGGLMAKWFGLASPLYIYAGACFVAAVLFWRTIRNPERHESEVRRGGIRRLPWNRAFVTVLVVNGVYLWMIGAIFSTLVPLFGTSDRGRAHDRRRGDRARDRHGDRARGAVPGRPRDRPPRPPRRADPGARGARADHGGVRVRHRRRSASWSRWRSSASRAGTRASRRRRCSRT